jgi:hypothetical protein
MTLKATIGCLQQKDRNMEKTLSKRDHLAIQWRWYRNNELGRLARMYRATMRHWDEIPPKS